MRIAVWTGGALPLVLALALGGCGGSSSSASSSGSATAGSSTELAGTPGVKTSSRPSSIANGDTVAHVEATAITKPTYSHWLAVTTALSAHRTSTSGPSLKDRTMGFVISAEWLLGEAAAERVQTSEAEIHKHLAEVQKQQFKHPGELQKYLKKAHETPADLLLRTKLELLESAIAKRVTHNKRTTAEKQAALARFQAQFTARWRQRTSCNAGYVMEDCKEFKGA